MAGTDAELASHSATALCLFDSEIPKDVSMVKFAVTLSKGKAMVLDGSRDLPKALCNLTPDLLKAATAQLSRVVPSAELPAQPPK